jgi:hypothetical protein
MAIQNNASTDEAGTDIATQGLHAAAGIISMTERFLDGFSSTQLARDDIEIVQQSCVGTRMLIDEVLNR